MGWLTVSLLFCVICELHQTCEMVLQLVGLVRQLWKNITLEPVVILYTLILALSSIPGEELYLMKACKEPVFSQLPTNYSVY